MGNFTANNWGRGPKEHDVPVATCAFMSNSNMIMQESYTGLMMEQIRNSQEPPFCQQHVEVCIGLRGRIINEYDSIWLQYTTMVFLDKGIIISRPLYRKLYTTMVSKRLLNWCL